MPTLTKQSNTGAVSKSERDSTDRSRTRVDREHLVGGKEQRGPKQI
jgi:hypothetical protein